MISRQLFYVKCQSLCKGNVYNTGRLFLINCITNISNKNLGSAGGTKIKIKSVVPLRDDM